MLEERDALLEQISAHAEQEARVTPSEFARVRGNYDAQLARVNAQLEEIGPDDEDVLSAEGVEQVAVRDSAAGRSFDGSLPTAGVTDAPTNRGDPRSPAPQSERQSAGAQNDPRTQHPIESVAGRFVRVADLIEARLANNDHAFSESTRKTLTRARQFTARTTADGVPLVDVSAFVRALVDIGNETTSEQPATVAQAIAHVLRTTDTTGGSTRKPRVAPQAPRQGEEHESAALADDGLTAVLADAAQLTPLLMPGEVRIDVTAAAMAALRTAAAQRVLVEDAAPVDGYQAFFSRLSDAVLDVARRTTKAPEGVLRELRPTLAVLRDSVAPERRSPVRFVDDRPAETLDQDRLGMAADAKALAEVICLREPGPPLAVGLFGDWGAGKTTFMNLLEASIEQVTGAQTAAGGEDSAEQSPFVGKVIHIRFNAWHYNDANLWASLTSEFFAQLRAGGAKSQARGNYRGIVRQVMQKVEDLETEITTAVSVTDSASTRAADARRRLQTLDKERQLVTPKAAGAAVAELVTHSAEPELTRYERALALLGRPAQDTTEATSPTDRRTAIAAAAENELVRVASFGGRLSALASAVFRSARSWDDYPAALGLVFGVLLLIVAAVGLFMMGHAMWLRFGAVLGVSLSSLLIGALRVYRTVKPLFAASRRFERERRKALDALDEQTTAARAQLLDAEKAAVLSARTRSAAEIEAARFRGAAPAQVLDFYLNESKETRQFEGELGTISKVRRLFEQLDAIYREAGLEPDPEPAGGPQAGPPPISIDRIVLYIDDLDRCSPQQVVRVLEAVHLLLAFPLFVVVVGVDARWLRQALQTVYRRQLRRSGSSEDSVASVHDYLEKIFQIPIQLRSLAHTQQAMLSGYVEAISGTETTSVKPTPSQGNRPTGAPLRPTSTTPLTPVDVQLAPETQKERVERVMLRPQELQMMSALAPILGRSPRSVKRFVNLYRLIRGRRRGAALDAFLDGAGDSRATFPAFQFWLAVSTGLPSETAALYRSAATDWMTFTSLPATLDGDADDIGEGGEHQAATNLRAHLGGGLAKRHAAAIRAVTTALGTNGDAAFISAAEEVSLYSLPSGV